MGWRGPLAISNQPRQRSFAEHSGGWDGEVSIPSGTLRVSFRVALTKVCGTLNAISNIPLRRKNCSLLVNHIRFQEEVIINY